MKQMCIIELNNTGEVEMKTLTKLFTATALTTALLANTAQANNAICDDNSKFITDIYTTISDVVKNSSYNKFIAIGLMRDMFKTSAKSKYKGHQLKAHLILGNHAFDYVDENFDKMKRMSNAEIKRIGYKTCGDVKRIINTRIR